MKRSRSESKAMDKAILDLFKEVPEAKLTKNRHKTNRVLLTQRFSELKDIPKERMCQIIFDCVTPDRRLRLWTQGEEVELKKLLAGEYVVNELM